MEHEGLAPLALERIDDLGIARRAERGGDQRLRLAAGEKCRAMSTREHSDLDRDRTHGARITSIDARLAGENALAHDATLEFEELVVDRFGTPLRHISGGQRRLRLLLDLSDARVPLLLVGDAIGLAERPLGTCRQRRLQRTLGGRWLPLEAWLARLIGKRANLTYGFLHLLMAEYHRPQHDLLGQSLGLRFDHQYRIGGAGDHQLEARAGLVGARRIEQVLPVFVTDAGRADRAIER